MSEPQHLPILSENIVCFALMTANITGTDGGLPKCLGKLCSNFPECCESRMRAVLNIEKMERGETQTEDKEDN